MMALVPLLGLPLFTAIPARAASPIPPLEECRTDVEDLAKLDVAVIGVLGHIQNLQFHNPKTFMHDSTYLQLVQMQLPASLQARRDSIDQYNLDAAIDGCQAYRPRYPSYQDTTTLFATFPSYLGKGTPMDLSSWRATFTTAQFFNKEDHLLMELWYWSNPSVHT
jgi:hypothetical protein